MESDSFLTISQITDAIRHTLNGDFANIWVSGEISGMTRPQSGHIYLTLKDDLAQLSTVIWRSTAEQLNFSPQEGTQVLCRGYIDVYPQRGAYQLIVQSIQPLGLGELQQAFRKLHHQLKQEGLFDENKKQPLPRFPRRIAVLTSPTGAAIQDFLHVVTRRWPHLDILIMPVKVQGAGASNDIAAALKRCGSRKFSFKPDIVVVTRGGGSIEDLWAFNEEKVVRAIYNCPVPVVSAVGHEIDVSLSDLAADLRALTPSEAGEKIVPNLSDVTGFLTQSQQRLSRLLQQLVRERRDQLASLSNRPCVRQPFQITRGLAQQLDSLEIKLHQLSNRKFEIARQRLSHFQEILNLSAQTAAPRAKQKLNDIGRQLSTSINAKSRQLKQQLEVIESKLRAFNPDNVLQRGYSLTLDTKGMPVVDCRNVKPGDRIETWLSAGKIASCVEAVDASLKFKDHGEKEN